MSLFLKFYYFQIRLIKTRQKEVNTFKFSAERTWLASFRTFDRFSPSATTSPSPTAFT